MVDAIGLLTISRRIPEWIPGSKRLNRLFSPPELTLDEIADRLVNARLVRVEDSRQAASFLIDSGRNGLSDSYRVVEYKDVRNGRIDYQFYQL